MSSANTSSGATTLMILVCQRRAGCTCFLGVFAGMPCLSLSLSAAPAKHLNTKSHHCCLTLILCFLIFSFVMITAQSRALFAHNGTLCDQWCAHNRDGSDTQMHQPDSEQTNKDNLNKSSRQALHPWENQALPSTTNSRPLHHHPGACWQPRGGIVASAIH